MSQPGQPSKPGDRTPGTDPDAMSDHPAPPPWQALTPDLSVDRPPRLGARRIVLSVLSLLLVIALLAWALPWAAGTTWPQIIDSLRGLPPWAVPAMLLLGLGALALEAWTVRTAVPGSRYGTALRGHAESSALALAVPGGGVLGMGLLGWILRRTGLGLSVVIAGILTASLVETVVTTVLVPLVGGIAYVVAGMITDSRIDLPAAALWAALAAVAGGVIALGLFAVLLRRPVLTGLLETASAVTGMGGTDKDTPGGSASFAPFVLEQRDALVRLLRERPLSLVAPTAAARMLQWLALVLAIEAVGGSVPLLLTVALFALGRVLSLVPLTPGGAGVSETVGAAALVALGLGSAAAATSMLLLAVATLVVPLVAGGLAAVLSVSRGSATQAQSASSS